MESTILRRTAAEIAALAVHELYPDVELLGGGETPVGFEYYFYFPHPIKDFIIEEKMREIVKQRRPIQTVEMVPFSARELLKSLGQFSLAEGLDEEGLVELIKIGDFYDLSQGPHLKNTFDLAAFKIECEALDEKQMRIKGYCERSKAALKEFLKKLAKYVDPQVEGERLGLWKGDIWFANGIVMREKLIRFLKDEWFKDSFEIASGRSEDRLHLHRTMQHGKVAEFWQEGPNETHMQISFFDKPEEELNSSLQMIGKTLTILGFEHSTVPRGGDTDFVVVDGLGRECPIVRLKKIPAKGAGLVDFTITAVVEEMLAQMIEKNLIMVELENK